MKQYLDLVNKILKKGKKKEDRTNTGTISLFGEQMRFNLEDGFPLLTTKKVYLKAIIHELLWFLSGSTNIKYLVDNNVKIWNEWPYEKYRKSKKYKGETLEEFVLKIKTDNKFSKKWGDLGPVYGKQWRNFNGVDQIKELIKNIKTNPTSRRLIISSWNPSELKDMALYPCHAFMQFYVLDDKLSLHLYQRSGDVFLGIPFNIASYSLLLMMVSQVVGLKPYEFVHTIGDCHIYTNHIEQLKLQLTRKPRKLPKMILNKNVKDIFKFKYEDFEIKDYNPYPAIKGKVAV